MILVGMDVSTIPKLLAVDLGSESINKNDMR